MNLANKLTVSRIFVIPFFVVFLLPQAFGLPTSVNPVFSTLALIVFVYAAISDYYDGALARRHGWISNFGKLFDPLADKLIVAAALVALIELDVFAAWMVITILCREFLITGLRTLAISEGKVLAADRWGKNKTISQMTTIITALVFVAARDILLALGYWESHIVERWDVAQYWFTLTDIMMWISVALTILSGWLYFRKNWDVVRGGVEH